MALVVKSLPIDKVTPNVWNPNVQNEHQYRAEIESILTNGFLAPILVREVTEGEYEVIDGEHRHRALKQIFDEGKTGHYNIPELAKKRLIPAVIIDADEATAKKLTVIMNETRGRADMASLGALLASIRPTFGDDLVVGLPYTENQLQELIEIGNFDWNELTSSPEIDVTEGSHEPQAFKVVATMDDATAHEWQVLMAQHKADLPSDKAQAAGKLISILMHKEM